MAEDTKSPGATKGWREKLGMKSDLPKLAEEFQARQPEAPARPAPARPEGEPGGHAATLGKPVRQPAPMAPRPGSAPPAPRIGETREGGRLDQRPPARPSPPPAVGERRPMPAAADRMPTERRPMPAGTDRLATDRRPPDLNNRATERAEGPATAASRPVTDAFAERLRAQREAAEKLARQRHSEARAVREEARMARPAPSSGGPKFTLAPEEIDAARDERQAPVRNERPASARDERPAAVRSDLHVPPRRPDLEHGEAGPAYRPPAARPGAQPGYTPPAYTPGDRFRAAPQDYREPDDLTHGDAAEPPAGPVHDDHDRRMPPRAPEMRSEQRLPLPPAAPRRDAYRSDDLDDVFEDEAGPPRAAPPRRRASVEDYSAAYRGFEDEVEDDKPRRRSGPLILMLALLLVAAIAGALIYLYNNQMKSTSGTPAGEVPVITAPQEPAKVEPEPQPEPAQPSQPQGRKQIYDRILGEETLEPERIVPTEEQPALPEGQTGTGQDGDQGGEPLPLPLPPPGSTSGQQGAIDPGGGGNVTELTPGTAPASGSGASSVIVAEPASQTPADSSKQNATDLSGLPVPGEIAETGGNPAAAAVGSDEAPAATDETSSASNAPTPRPKPSALAARVREQRAARPAQAVQPAQPAQQAALPPSQPAAPLNSTGAGPVLLAPQPDAGPATQPESGGILSKILQPSTGTGRTTVGGRAEEDPLAGTRPGINRVTVGTAPAIAEPVPAATPPAQQPAATVDSGSQIAALPQPQAPAAPNPSTGGSGYVVQLAAFKTEGEALNEYQRVRSRHPGLVGGLSSRITEADLGASGKFYRLGIGPIDSRAQASQLCNSLIAAGEKDCLVRRQ